MQAKGPLANTKGLRLCANKTFIPRSGDNAISQKCWRRTCHASI